MQQQETVGSETSEPQIQPPEGQIPSPAIWERSVGKCAVSIPDHDRINLLGLLLANVLERALEDPRLQRKCAPLRGDVKVQAGRMKVRLKFDKGRVEVLPTGDTRARASVAADLTTLTDVTLGGGIVRHYFRGRIKVGGNLFFLLKLLPLLRVGRKGSGSHPKPDARQNGNPTMGATAPGTN